MGLIFKGKATWSYDFLDDIDLESATEFDEVMVTKLAWNLKMGDNRLAFSGREGKSKSIYLLRTAAASWHTGYVFPRELLLANSQGNPLLWPHLVNFMEDEAEAASAIALALFTREADYYSTAEARLDPFLARAGEIATKLNELQGNLDAEAEMLAR